MLRGCRIQPQTPCHKLSPLYILQNGCKISGETKRISMSKPRTLALLIVLAHGTVAIWHLFLAAKVLPPPNNNVSWMAIILLTSLHLAVSIALRKLSTRFTGLVSLIFFLAALSADLYEHFLHASGNNVSMVAPGDWTALFDVSVFALLTLEILGCLLGISLLGGRTKNSTTTPRLNSNLNRQGPKLSSSLCKV